ncbi:MAG: diguanylate cyclase [Dokdonella sp.]
MRDRLENAVAAAARHGSRLAVLFVDLDQFKNINDTMGHLVGDEVLQLMARRLEAAMRDSDTVSRHGGEEFLVLLPEISDRSDARVVAEKISVQMAAPTRVGNGVILQVSASIGIAIYPDDGADAAVLISKADAAMYRSKRRRRGAFEFYGADTSSDNRSVVAAADAKLSVLQALDVSRDEDRSRLRDLREANERLLMATLTAQTLEAQSIETRRRHVGLQSMVAHALRLPLAPIRIATALLENFRSDEAMLAQLPALIARHVSQLETLIDDLVDAAPANAGDRGRMPSDIELTDIVAMAVEILKPRVALKDQRLTSRLVPAPLRVQGEAVRLTQALVNLLHCACRSTPRHGEIVLVVEESIDKVTITLSGNLRGFGVNMPTRISSLYAKTTRALARGQCRLEVGLAQVRAIVELHGGSVAKASAGRDRGSQFVMTLLRAGTSGDGVAERSLDTSQQ